MADEKVAMARIHVMDKTRLREIVAEQNAQIGFDPDPTGTP